MKRIEVTLRRHNGKIIVGLGFNIRSEIPKFIAIVYIYTLYNDVPMYEDK